MRFSEHEPIYLQIAQRICEQIMSGVLVEEQRLPSTRDLAILLEVNPNTVMRTYTHLQESDIISNRRGRGYFVAANSSARIRESRRKIFIERELPKFLRSMKMLGFTINDIGQFYAQLKEDNNNA